MLRLPVGGGEEEFQSRVSVGFRRCHPAGLGGPGGDWAAQGYSPRGTEPHVPGAGHHVQRQGPCAGWSATCLPRQSPSRGQKNSRPETPHPGAQVRARCCLPCLLGTAWWVPTAAPAGRPWLRLLGGPGVGPGRVPTDRSPSPHQGWASRAQPVLILRPQERLSRREPNVPTLGVAGPSGHACQPATHITLSPLPSPKEGGPVAMAKQTAGGGALASFWGALGQVQAAGRAPGWAEPARAGFPAAAARTRRTPGPDGLGHSWATCRATGTKALSAVPTATCPGLHTEKGAKVAALPGDPITSWGPFPSPCREPLHLPPSSPPHLSSASCKLKMASVPRRAGPALVCPGESHAPGLMAGSPQDQLSPCKRRRIGPHSVPGRPRPGRWAQMTGRPPWAPLSLTGGPGLLTSLQTGQGGLGSVCLPLCQQSQASVPRPSTADTR